MSELRIQMSRANRKHQVSLFEWSLLGATKDGRNAASPVLRYIDAFMEEDTFQSSRRLLFFKASSIPEPNMSQSTIGYWSSPALSRCRRQHQRCSQQLKSKSIDLRLSRWEPKICLYNGKQVTNPVTKCMWKYISPTQPVNSEPSQGHTLSRALGGIHLPDVFLPGIPWSCKNWIFQSNELPGYRLESRISRYITWPLHIDMWHIPKTKGLNSVSTSRGFAQFTLSEKGPSQR